MNRYQPPYFTILISTITLGYSFFAAYDIGGFLFHKVRINQLEPYGGVTLDHLANFEVWRLFAAQLIHVKQFHMLFNVASLLLLGMFVERHIGFFRMFLLWFIVGALGTIFSTLFVSAPWNLGTGASQAIMGIAAFGVLLNYRNIDQTKGLKYSILFALIPALLLDLVFSHYPKPGHLLGFAVGWLIGLFYLKEIVDELELNSHVRCSEKE